MSTATPSTSLTASTTELRAGLRGQLGDEILSVYDRDAAALGAGDAFAAVSGDHRWRVGPEEVLAALRA